MSKAKASYALPFGLRRFITDFKLQHKTSVIGSKSRLWSRKLRSSQSNAITTNVDQFFIWTFSFISRFFFCKHVILPDIFAFCTFQCFITRVKSNKILKFHSLDTPLPLCIQKIYTCKLLLVVVAVEWWQESNAFLVGSSKSEFLVTNDEFAILNIDKRIVI